MEGAWLQGAIRMTYDFYITSLIVVLVPGTGVVYTISNGLFRGRVASSVAAFGCTLGILPHILTSLLGISVLLNTNEIIFQLFKLVGVMYLFYLAFNIWMQDGIIAVGKPKDKKSFIRICFRGFMINILNPKLSIFFLAFLPQFIPINEVFPLKLMFTMSAIFMALTLIIFLIYGATASRFRDYVISSPVLTQWIQRSFAVAFAAFGLKLALLV